VSGISLEGVTKRYGDIVAVNDVTLDIDEGDLFSFVGPSGCGKTTLLRIIAGLDRPDAGKIWIGGRLVSSERPSDFVPPGERGLGLVFQNYALWPHMTVNAIIGFGL
jgi:ABC-type Fe3+/spermidine/putrescine transport system ATPase subunit